MKVSVVIASFRAAEVVAEVVGRLRSQCIEAGAELIVARSAPSGSPDPEAIFEGCTIVHCRPGESLPAIRGAGLAAATGDFVLLTEDNCVPRAKWIPQMLTGFSTGAAIVGGTMGNAHPVSAVDTAAFLAEYGFFGESRTEPGGGASPMVSGANVGYSRAVVGDAAAWATAGGWEGTIHHRLVLAGARVVLVRNAVVDQHLRFDIVPYCRDRFEHGVNYASNRSDSWGIGARLAMAAATVALPPLQIWRAWRHAGRLDPAGFARALPLTLLFFAAWAIGETQGYLGMRKKQK